MNATRTRLPSRTRLSHLLLNHHNVSYIVKKDKPASLRQTGGGKRLVTCPKVHRGFFPGTQRFPEILTTPDYYKINFSNRTLVSRSRLTCQWHQHPLPDRYTPSYVDDKKYVAHDQFVAGLFLGFLTWVEGLR